MSRADEAFATLRNLEAALCEFLRLVLPDPALADSLAEQATVRLQINLAGQRFPTTCEIDKAKRDARAAELLVQVGATVAALRLDVDRVTVYRRARRAQQRKRAA